MGAIPYQFAPLPHAVLDAGVSAPALGTYAHLLRHHSSGVTVVGLERLAQKLCCCVRTVSKYITELVQANLIRVEEREGRASRYTIVAWVEPPTKSAYVLDPPEDHSPSGSDPIPDQDGSDPIQAPTQKLQGKVHRVMPKQSGGYHFDRRPKPDEKPIRKTVEPEQTPDPVEQPGTGAAALEGPRPVPPEEEQPEVLVVPEDVPQPTPEPEIHVHLDPVPPELVNDNEYDPQSFAQKQLAQTYPLQNGWWVCGPAVMNDSQLMSRRSTRIELAQKHLDQRRRVGLPLKIKDRYHWLTRNLPQVEQTPAVRVLQSLLACFRYKPLDGVFKPIDGCWPCNITIFDVAQANRLTEREVRTAMEQLGIVEEGFVDDVEEVDVVTEADGMPRLDIPEDQAFWQGMAFWKITRDPDGQLRCDDRVITLDELAEKRPIAAKQIRAFLQRTQP